MTSEKHDPEDPEQALGESIESARQRAEALRAGPAGVDPSELETVREDDSVREGGKIGSRYSLVRRIGEGGMGVVWLARDLALNEPVALKFLPFGVSDDPKAVRELREEARVMRGLTHSSIVRLHDIRFTKGKAFLVQAYMEGGSLGDLLESQPGEGLSTEEAMWALREVVPGLTYAHAHGITHRDIKPANLLLSHPPGDFLGDGGESLRVADFGLAFAAHQSISRSSGYRPSGTLAFMAPEILLGKRPTPAADVYSLAATIFCMIEGRPPFDSGEVASQILHVPAPDLCSGDEALDQAVAMALSKNIDERPASPEEFLRIAEEGLPQRAGGSRISKLALMPIGIVATLLLLLGAFVTRGLWLAAEPEALPESEQAEPVLSAVARDSMPADATAPQDAGGSTGAPEQVAVVPQAREANESSSAPDPRPEDGGLAKFLQRISRAPTIEGVAATLREAQDAGLRGDCEALCVAAIPALRSLLERESERGERSIAEGLERLQVLDGAASLSSCGRSDDWRQLASDALSISTLESDLERLDGLQGCATIAAWDARVTDHATLDHVCLLRHELSGFRRSARDAQARLLDAALEASGPGFLLLLGLLESTGEGLPTAMLPSVRERIASIQAGESWDRDEEWALALALYLADGSSSGVAAEGRQALRRLEDSLVERTVEESGPADATKLFARLARLEPLLISTGHTQSGAVDRLPSLVAKRFRGRTRQLALLAASFEYLSERPETSLVDTLVEIVQSTGLELSKALRAEKDLEDAIALVDQVYAIEAGHEAIVLEVQGAPVSAFQDLRAEMEARIQKLVDVAREKRNKKRSRLSHLSSAAESLGSLALALKDSRAFAWEYVAILPDVAETNFEWAQEKNRIWRDAKDSALFHVQAFETAVEWAERRVLEAHLNPDDPLSPITATSKLVDVRLAFADHYRLLCRRHFRPLEVGGGSVRYVPKKELRAGQEQAGLAAAHLRELDLMDPAGTWCESYEERLGALEDAFEVMSKPSKQ